MGRNPSLMKSMTPALENRKYGGLQHTECILEALWAEVIASRKAVFQVRYLRRQVPIGLNGALVRAARTNSSTKQALSNEE